MYIFVHMRLHAQGHGRPVAVLGHLQGPGTWKGVFYVAIYQFMCIIISAIIIIIIIIISSSSSSSRSSSRSSIC